MYNIVNTSLKVLEAWAPVQFVVVKDMYNSYLHYRRLCTSSSTGLKIRGKTGLAIWKRWITKLYVSA